MVTVNIQFSFTALTNAFFHEESITVAPTIVTAIRGKRVKSKSVKPDVINTLFHKRPPKITPVPINAIDENLNFIVISFMATLLGVENKVINTKAVIHWMFSVL